MPHIVCRSYTVMLSIVLMAVLLLSPILVHAAESRMLGDVNGNGMVDTMDSLILYRHTCGSSFLTPSQAARADIDQNGMVDLRDTLALYLLTSGRHIPTDPRPTFTTSATILPTAVTTVSTLVTTTEPIPPTTAIPDSTETFAASTTADASSIPYNTFTTAVNSGAILKGIDVSYSQGKIDWEKAKQDGVQFAILRCGYGQDEDDQDDDEWERNVAECERLGIPWGAYFFCYARTEVEALGEARHALRLLKGKHPTLPVFYDLEYSSWQGNLCPALYAKIATIFCVTLTQNGYKAGVYANLSWWEDKLTAPVFDSWYRWIAQYHDECQYDGIYQLWQYTEDGHVKGIEGLVDMNECYVDFSSIS